MMADKKNYSAQLYQKIRDRGTTNAVFIDRDKSSITYRYLDETIHKIIAFFHDYPLQKDARVIIFTHHDQQAIPLFISALLDGVIPIIVSADTKPHRLKAIIRKVTPELIFIDIAFKELWPWLGEYPCITIFDTERTRRNSSERAVSEGKKRIYPFPEVLNRYEGKRPRCSGEPDDIAFIIFTSGTTSTPKGILITHKNLFEHLETIGRIFSYNENHRIFNNMDLAHADGLVQGPLLALHTGALLFRPKRFAIQNLEKLVSKIKNKKISHFITVPTILSLIDRFLKRDDYFSEKSFAHLISVAAKIDSNLWLRLQDRFNIRICNIYGLTETVSGGLFCGPDDEMFTIGTVGKPIDMEAKIVDDQGSVCGVGIEGELWLKGTNVTPGYLDEPEATKALFAGDWLRTGDIAVQDSNNFFRIVGRKKAVIVSGGYNIHPDEINEVLLLNQNVIDAATVGIYDKDWGELVASVVESDVLIDETELTNHCRMHLESIKVPKKILLLKKLPRGISGKIKLREIKKVLEQFRQDEYHDQSIAIEEIMAIAATVFNSPGDFLDPDLPPIEIPGWDSLGHLNLITAVEKKYDVEFNVDEIMQVNSLRSLCDMISTLSDKSSSPQTAEPPHGSPLSEAEYNIIEKVVASSTVGKKNRGSFLLGRNIQGQKKPLYWCFNATDIELASLAIELGYDQPIYALYSGSGVMNRSIPVDRLAEHYVNELLGRDSSDTFLIGGHCRGAAVAWKMVQLMEQRGRKVEKVCLLEYFSPEMFAGGDHEMLLLFGEQSPFAFPKQFNWQEQGWEQKFETTPQVHLTPGTHGDVFFTASYIEPLAEKICHFLDSKVSET